MIKTIIGSFDNVDDADRAYRDLRQAGFPDADLNLIVSNSLPGRDDIHPVERTDIETGSAAKGAVAGGVLGGAAGLAVSLMGLAIPGIGPILAAGPIVAALAGAGAGAVAGGLIGALTDLGVEKDEAELYAESVRRGGSLVTARADESRADEVAAMLRKNGAVDIARRAEEWKSEGWTGHDTKAEPMTAAEIERDRAKYAERPTMTAAEGLSDSAWALPSDEEKARRELMR
jgi:hypothetical protein